MSEATGERPVTGTSVEVVGYVPSVVMTTQQAAALVACVEEAKREVMRSGVDYARIPGTPKPSLLKPGAERLAQLFGFGHTMGHPLVEVDGLGRPHRVTIRCDVTKGGEIVSSCWGSCDYDEDRYYKPFREATETPETGEIIGARKEYRAPWNTLLKMADKRAYVGAMLKATASSGLFTQDLEGDLEGGKGRRSRSTLRHTSADPDAVTPDQLTKIHTMFSFLDMTDRDVRLKYASAIVNRDVASSKDLTKREASKLIDALEHEAEQDARRAMGEGS